MKEIKQKPAGGKPKTADAARVPKAVVKAAWLQAREAARAGEKQVVGGKDGAYSGAADTGEKGADKLVSTGERVTELAYRGGRKLAERSAGQRRERAKAAQTGGEAAQRHGAGETIAHTIANSLNVSSDYLIGRIDTPVPESTVVGNLISELTTEEVIYLVSILSRYVEILKKAGTDRNENSSV